MTPDETECTLDLDVIATLKELGGDDEPELFLELVDLFLQDATAHLDGLQDALERGDPLALERTAHTLKSSCANLGAARMSRLCFELEQLGKARSLEGAGELVQQTVDSFASVSVALEAQRI